MIHIALTAKQQVADGPLIILTADGIELAAMVVLRSGQR